MSDLIDVVASFIPPTDANFRGVHGYLEAPDFSFSAAFQVNVTAVGSGVVQGIRIDLGIASSTLPNAAGVITVVWKTNLPYPSVGMPTQTYRLYFQSVGPNYDPPIVASNQPNATPSLTFLVAPATAFGAGEEFAPRVTDPLVTLETRFEQSTYSYRPTVVWKDPVATDYPARISSFAGVEVVVLPLVGLVPVPQGFGRNANPNARGFASRFKVSKGVMTWTGNWVQIPTVIETHTGELLSYDTGGNVNSFQEQWSPQFSYDTPDLDKVRNGTAMVGGYTNTGIFKPGFTIASPLPDVKNFSVGVGYNYDLTGLFDYQATPYFDQPTQGDWNDIGFVVNIPSGSLNYYLLGYPSSGNGDAGDIAFIDKSAWPTAAASWDFIAVSMDVNGKSKYPDLDNLTALRNSGTAPNFGTSPRVTVAVAGPYNSAGSGIEVSPVLGSVTAVLNFGTDIDGSEFYWLSGTVTGEPTDNRYKGYTIQSIIGGVRDDVVTIPPGVTAWAGKRAPMPTGSVAVTVIALSNSANNSRNSYVAGVTPGVLCSAALTAQTTGMLDLSRHNSSKVNTAQFRKNPTSGKFEVLPGGITGTEIADGTMNYAKFFTGLRPIEIVTTLPATFTNYPIGAVVALTTDQKLYRSTGSAWIKTVQGADVIADTALINNIQAIGIQAINISALGTLTVGGPGVVSVLTVKDSIGAVIGYIGGGTNGGWLKTLGVGGINATNAALSVDSAGNIVITNTNSGTQTMRLQTVTVGGYGNIGQFFLNENLTAGGGAGLFLSPTSGMQLSPNGATRQTNFDSNGVLIKTPVGGGAYTETLRLDDNELTFNQYLGYTATGIQLYGVVQTGPANCTATSPESSTINALLAVLRSIKVIA